MMWFFERDSESFQIETRYDTDTAEFVLIMYRPTTGGPQIERFKNAGAFRQRLEALEGQLTSERWTQRGSILLHDGWKL